jgi:transposase
MHMVGYFEGIASERGIAWQCSDSMSLRDFLRLENREKVPDHSWLSKTRGRLPHEVHETVFDWVLRLVAEKGLIRGKRIGIDASTMEANAALRTIVRREDGRSYREMLTQMAKESGIETPSADDLVRIDRARKGKKLSNDEWTSQTDPDAKIAKLKDGRTHLGTGPSMRSISTPASSSRQRCIPPTKATQRRSRERWPRRRRTWRRLAPRRQTKSRANSWRTRGITRAPC